MGAKLTSFISSFVLVFLLSLSLVVNVGFGAPPDHSSGGGNSGNSKDKDGTKDDSRGNSKGGSKGDSKGDSDGGTVGSVTGGVAVDPYFVGATFFEDVNGDGRWDKGEQISTPSDEQGRFTFATPVPVGSAIVMLERGTHQGLPFTGQVRRLITEEDSGTVVVTPLTTLLTQAFTEGDISSLLTLLNGYQDYDFSVNPMAGLEELDGSVNDAQMDDLRANLYVGALLDLFQVSQEFDKLNNYNLEPDNDALLHGLREGLWYAVHPAARNRIVDLLPTGYSLPLVSMLEVAETMPVILNWWKQELISRALQGYSVSVSADEFKALVDEVQAELGLHYYLRLHQDDAGVQAAIAALLLPEVDTAYVALSRNNVVGPVEALEHEVLLGQSLMLGDDSRLRFFKDQEGDHGTVELTFATGSLSGTWRIEAEAGAQAVLILEDGYANLVLELEANHHSHLSMRVNARADDYDQTRFIGRLLLEAGSFKVS